MVCPACCFQTHDATRDGRGVRTRCTPRQREPGVDWGFPMVPRAPVGVGTSCGRRDHGCGRGPGHGRSVEAPAVALRHDLGLGHRLCVRPNGGLGHQRWPGPLALSGSRHGPGHRHGAWTRRDVWAPRWPWAMTWAWGTSSACVPALARGPNGSRSHWLALHAHPRWATGDAG
jgi:hypothetical protein